MTSRANRARLAAVLAVTSAVAGGWGRPTRLAAQEQPSPVFALVPAHIELGAVPVRVQLTVAGAPASSGFSVDVLFDPMQVAVTGIDLGDWAGSTGRPVQPLGPSLNQPGRLVLGALMVGDAPAPEGDGVLAVLTLAGLAHGTSNLTLSKALLVRSEGSQPLPALAQQAAVVVSDVPQAAATAAVAAAATLAAAPHAGLVPDFVRAVEAEATQGAPGLGATVATAVASFTPGDVMATPVALLGQSGVEQTSNSGRNVVLAAALVGAMAFWWVGARRRPPL